MIPFLLFQLTSNGIDPADPIPHITVSVGAEADTVRTPGMVDTVAVGAEPNTVRVI